MLEGAEEKGFANVEGVEETICAWVEGAEEKNAVCANSAKPKLTACAEGAKEILFACTEGAQDKLSARAKGVEKKSLFAQADSKGAGRRRGRENAPAPDIGRNSDAELGSICDLCSGRRRGLRVVCWHELLPVMEKLWLPAPAPRAQKGTNCPDLKKRQMVCVEDGHSTACRMCLRFCWHLLRSWWS